MCCAGGLMLGGYVSHQINPGAFDDLPPSYSMTRAVLGGFMVGFGAALGKGCTSGHGLVGNARLSMRSFVFTLMFLITGMATATLTHTATALSQQYVAGGGKGRAELVWPSHEDLYAGGMMLASYVLSMMALVAMARKVWMAQGIKEA